MNILQELRHAAVEVAIEEAGSPLRRNSDKPLQRQWDEWIVWAFLNRPQYTTNVALSIFYSNTRINRETLDTLKRVPREYHHQHTMITRFVSGYLPKIGARLWETNKKDQPAIDKLLDWISRSNIDTLPHDRSMGTRRDLYERNGEKRRFKQHLKVNAERQSNWDAHKRSNQWGVCK